MLMMSSSAERICCGHFLTRACRRTPQITEEYQHRHIQEFFVAFVVYQVLFVYFYVLLPNSLPPSAICKNANLSDAGGYVGFCSNPYTYLIWCWRHLLPPAYEGIFFLFLFCENMRPSEKTNGRCLHYCRLRYVRIPISTLLHVHAIRMTEFDSHP